MLKIHRSSECQLTVGDIVMKDGCLGQELLNCLALNDVCFNGKELAEELQNNPKFGQVSEPGISL